jgi:hypothetical protein
VIVEGRTELEAERAQNVLHGMEVGEVDLVHRAGERPLRDVLAEREASDVERSFGTARSEMGEGHDTEVRAEGEFFPPERGVERERAMASQGWGEQRKLEVVPDDKPIASPDLRPPQDTEKPR